MAEHGAPERAQTDDDVEPPGLVGPLGDEHQARTGAATDAAAPTAAGTAATARRPRRGHLVLWSLAAVLAGVAAGGGTGYEVQAHRPPTPLPVLAQPQPAQPRLAAGISFAPLPVRQDTRVAFEDDLASFLLPKPAGVTDITDRMGGTMPSLLDYAQAEYARPSGGFTYLNDTGVISIGQRVWMQSGDVQVWDMLFRYTDQPTGTSNAQANGTNDATDMGIAGSSPTVTEEPSWGLGEVAVYSPAREGEEYEGIATSSDGDVEMAIQVYSPRPVSTSFMVKLGTSQWNRL